MPKETQVDDLWKGGTFRKIGDIIIIFSKERVSPDGCRCWGPKAYVYYVSYIQNHAFIFNKVVSHSIYNFIFCLLKNSYYFRGIFFKDTFLYFVNFIFIGCIIPHLLDVTECHDAL